MSSGSKRMELNIPFFFSIWISGVYLNAVLKATQKKNTIQAAETQFILGFSQLLLGMWSSLLKNQYRVPAYFWHSNEDIWDTAAPYILGRNL